MQTAVSAVNASCPVCPTRKFPAELCTSAALPTADNGELESIVRVIAPLVTVAEIVGNAGAELGLVGLPPHPANKDPNAAADIAPHACVQNSRLVKSIMRGRAATAVPASACGFSRVRERSRPQNRND